MCILDNFIITRSKVFTPLEEAEGGVYSRVGAFNEGIAVSASNIPVPRYAMRTSGEEYSEELNKNLLVHHELCESEDVSRYSPITKERWRQHVQVQFKVIS